MMNEQQRVFLTVFLCMGIFLGYQYFLLKTTPPAPVPAPQSAPLAQATTAAPPAQPSPIDAVATAALPTVANTVAEVKPEDRSFRTPLFSGKLSNTSAGLLQLQLLRFADHVGHPGAAPSQPLSLVAHSGANGGLLAAQAQVQWALGEAQPVALHFVEPGIEAANTAAGKPPPLVLEGKSLRGLEIRVEVTPRQDQYALDYTLRAKNTGTVALPVGASMILQLADDPEEGHGLLSGKGPGTGLRALCEADGKLVRKEASNFKEGPVSLQGAVRYMGLDRQYFMVAALAGGADPSAAVPPAVTAQANSCSMRRDQQLLQTELNFAPAAVAPGESFERRITVYAGPKRDAELGAVDAVLQDAIDYNIWYIPLGFLARPMVYFLGIFHQWTHSWGIAIMLLTLLVKATLFPVTYKSVLSMRKMQLLKPQLDALKTRFPDDRERQNMEQMKLFREKGVNPLGGCLPTLLQMPVWLALYRTLWSAVDLYHQSFLWIPDLTAKESFPFLALGLGALTVLQQRLTPMATDNQQAKVMMYVMPLMLTFLMVSLPSGLVLYILINTILTIIQQLAINRRAVAL
jgi:YidC/Oxa1 family membrane protein insertase